MTEAKERRDARVLLVDDDDEARELPRRALVEHGYMVFDAQNGREALQVLGRTGGPDIRLIISDIEMPEMTGVELLAVLSRNPQLSRIPVIVVSGASRHPVALQGAAGYLVKPVQVEQLLALALHHLPTS